jgi:hypothetical protein
MEDTLTSGEAYTFTLLEEWKSILNLSKIFEINYLNGRCDAVAINEHIGTLTNFYEALAPKVHSHGGTQDTGWKNLIAEFDSWKPWAENSIWFQSDMTAIKGFRTMLGDILRIIISYPSEYQEKKTGED